MIPFLCILAVFVMAIALALQVLVGKMLDPENPDSGEVVFASFGAPLDLVLRMAEGRQDMGGSVLEMLTKEGIQSNAEGAFLSAISCTIYLCFYFLFFFITIIALNALIALMGSSYEKVMEKKISQRWHSIYFYLIYILAHHNLSDVAGSYQVQTAGWDNGGRNAHHADEHPPLEGCPCSAIWKRQKVLLDCDCPQHS